MEINIYQYLQCDSTMLAALQILSFLEYFQIYELLSILYMMTKLRTEETLELKLRHADFRFYTLTIKTFYPIRQL